MNRLILFVFIVFCKGLQGQSIRRLVDKDSRQPIQFASIKILNQPRVTLSTITGEFDLHIAAFDTLMITSVGYEDLQLTGTEIQPIIQMVKKIKFLAPVMVAGQSTRIMLPIDKVSFSRDLQWGPSESFSGEFAQKITLDSLRSYRIRRILIPIGKFVCWGPIVVRLYLKDSMGLPGEMIFSHEFNEFEKKSKIAHIDFTGFNLYVGNATCLFVGISWTPGAKTSKCVTSLVLSKESTNETFSRSLTNINYSWYPFGRFNDRNGVSYTAHMFISMEVDTF